MTLDPIHQFEIHNYFKIGDRAIYFTNSSVYMLISIGVICLLMIGGVARPDNSFLTASSRWPK